MGGGIEEHVLVTGGLGYIGSHTAVDLLRNGYKVSVVDNLENSHLDTLGRIEALTGSCPTCYECDVRDTVALQMILAREKVDSVIHFAAKKSPSESLVIPAAYLSTNVGGTASLLEAMESSGIRRLVFSSSAAIYGDARTYPIKEDAAPDPLSPYAESKLLCEDMLSGLARKMSGWSIRILRYFNPVGAHPDGGLGESTITNAANLFPVIMKAMACKAERVQVYGKNFQSRDGTGVRDYVHVCDIASGHRMALRTMKTGSVLETINLGTGIGYTVLEILEAFADEIGQQVPYDIVDPRPGDPGISYADVSKARRLMQWNPRYSLREMVNDAWHWYSSMAQGN